VEALTVRVRASRRHADFKAWLDDRHFVYEDPSMRAAICTSR